MSLHYSIIVLIKFKHDKIIQNPIFTQFIQFPYIFSFLDITIAGKPLAIHITTFKTNLKHSQYHLNHKKSHNLINFQNHP
jgi:hypothetical protein